MLTILLHKRKKNKPPFVNRFDRAPPIDPFKNAFSDEDPPGGLTPALHPRQDEALVLGVK